MGLAEKTFLDTSDKNYFYKRKKVDLVLKSSNKPYILNIEHLKKNYNECYIHSIEEFAMNYCFGYFMLRPEIDSMIFREAMYIEIMEYYNNSVVSEMIL